MTQIRKMCLEAWALLIRVGIVLVLCSDCGGGIASSSTDGGSVQDSGIHDATPVSGCPLEEPAEGSKCSGSPVCGYGNSIHLDCRTVYTCEGTWVKHSGACAQTPAAFCPASTPSGSACTPIKPDSIDSRGPPCPYSDGTICHCPCVTVSCDVSTWMCMAPPASPCPTIAPNYGAPCEVQALECDYGAHCGQSEVFIRCRYGRWESAELVCPN